MDSVIVLRRTFQSIFRVQHVLCMDLVSCLAANQRHLLPRDG